MDISSAGREWLKWIALVLMTGDHVNKAWLDGAYPILGIVSRVVFPIFAILFAYNLYHSTPESRRLSMQRLLIAALIAQPFHVMAFGSLLTLNVLFTLFVGAAVCWLGSLRRWVPAVLLWVFAGIWVDYAWWGIAVMCATWLMIWARGEMWSACLLVLAVMSLVYINGNFWALLALPIIALFSQVAGTLPRWRYTFLAYYVGHLVLLAAAAG